MCHSQKSNNPPTTNYSILAQNVAANPTKNVAAHSSLDQLLRSKSSRCILRSLHLSPAICFPALLPARKSTTLILAVRPVLYCCGKSTSHLINYETVRTCKTSAIKGLHAMNRLRGVVHHLVPEGPTAVHQTPPPPGGSR